jgi:hypothetical protein
MAPELFEEHRPSEQPVRRTSFESDVWAFGLVSLGVCPLPYLTPVDLTLGGQQILTTFPLTIRSKVRGVASGLFKEHEASEQPTPRTTFKSDVWAERGPGGGDGIQGWASEFPGGGGGGQGQASQSLTINNHIYGARNCLVTHMILYFSQEVLEALVERPVYWVPVVMGVLAGSHPELCHQHSWKRHHR